MASNKRFYFENDPYFHPELDIQNSEIKSKILDVIGDILVPKEKAELFRQLLRAEIKKALKSDDSHDAGVLPMFNTFVYRFPTGKETGKFLGLDIGGTNLRIMSLQLDPNGSEPKKITLEHYQVPKECRQSESKKFFDYLAECIKIFLEKHFTDSERLSGMIPLGFTFSFGYDQLAINRGRCIQFGIATNLPDAIGKCPAELLQRSIDSFRLPVKVAALANDSTSTLIYGKFLDPENCFASLILGSGSNVAYIEMVENDRRIQDPSKTFNCLSPPKEFILNSECVLFGDQQQLDFLKSRYDFELDAMSLIPNSYTLEKMLGGAFLGELFRLALVDLVRNRLLLNGKFTSKIVQPQIIPTSDMSLIEAELIENKSTKFEQINRLLIERLGYKLDDIDQQNDYKIIAFVCQMLAIRSALLCASMLAAFIDCMDAKSRPNVSVSCDGSLYGKHPKMHRLINGYLQELCPDKKTKVFNVENGSCIGAALIAAIV